MKARQQTLRLRDDLIASLVRDGGDSVSVARANGHYRPRLQLRNGSSLSIYVIRSSRIANGELRWIFNVYPQERQNPALIARLDSDNKAFQDFYVVPDLRKRTCWRMKPEDHGLRRGRRLFSLADFEGIATAVIARRTQWPKPRTSQLK